MIEREWRRLRAIRIWDAIVLMLATEKKEGFLR